MNLNDFPPNGEKIPDMQDVLATAEIIKGKIHSMGANDVEFSTIDYIVSRVRNGVIEASEAILKLQLVLDSKQDYH